MADITLKKLNIVGEIFFHVFKDKDGKLIEVETTEEDYRQLGKKNPKNPTKEGCTWHHSYSDYKYDSASGRMEDGTYADNGNGYRILVNGVHECALEKSVIVADKITTTKIAEVSDAQTLRLNR
jgi:hypothetical protein